MNDNQKRIEATSSPPDPEIDAYMETEGILLRGLQKAVELKQKQEANEVESKNEKERD